MRLAIAVTSVSSICPTVETTNRVTLIRVSRIVGKLEMSCALQKEYNLVNGVEISSFESVRRGIRTDRLLS